MSAPIENTFLTGLLNTAINPNSWGSGSGSVNFLNGLDFTSLGGSGSGSMSGILGSMTSLLGPIGAGAGAIASLVPGLNEFLQNGFDFTCLGSQAYSKSDLDNDLMILQNEVKNLNANDLNNVGIWLTNRSKDIAVIQYDIDKRYKSGCSKQLAGKRKEAYQGSVDQMLQNFNYTKEMISFNDYEGTKQNAYKYTIQSLKGSGSVSPSASVSALPQITHEQFETEYVPQLKAYASAKGLNEDELIASTYAKFFPYGGGGGWNGSGGVHVNEDGTVDVSINASNGKQPNYTLYALLAVGGLFAWKMLKK